MEAPTTIHCLMPPWRRVLLFQSFRQFLSYVACVSASTLAGMLILNGLTQLRGHDPLPVDIIAWTVIGSLIGSLRLAYRVMPCQWRLAAARPGIIFNRAPDILAGIRYQATEHTAGRTLYRLSVPWYMRWPDSGENAVELRVEGPDVVITGARVAVARLRNALGYDDLVLSPP